MVLNFHIFEGKQIKTFVINPFKKNSTTILFQSRLEQQCVALMQSEFLVNFCIPEKLNSYIEERCLLLRYPTQIFFSLSLILRERGHHELPVFSPLIFLLLLAIFPVGKNSLRLECNA